MSSRFTNNGGKVHLNLYEIFAVKSAIHRSAGVQKRFPASYHETWMRPEHACVLT